jgi:hypothetical protein
MAKPPRSPLLGYNHNVKYGGHIFHVQTEDSGPGNPHIFTHLFYEGSILASKRGQYAPDISEDEVRTMMQAQHKAILKELKQTAFDERIARFFSLRGVTFRADDFFVDDSTATAQAAPAAEPTEPTLATAVASPASDVAVLDLDALPNAPVEKPATPEPLPIHVTQPALPGPGTYTFRRPSREQLSVVEPGPSPTKAKPAAGARPGPQRASSVVVQRQVVVGGGAAAARKPTTTPVRRRPVSGGPYVVKEGSHANVAGSVQGKSPVPPPRSVAPSADASRAPRTAETKRSPEEGAPTNFVTDQSLDDVILAYLSQGEGKR